MTIYEGNDITLAIGDAPNPEEAAFFVLQGIRISRLRIETPVFPVRNAGSGAWMDAASGAGQRRLVVEGEGVFHDGAGETLLLTYALSGAMASLRCAFGNGESLQCPAQLTRFERLQDLGQPERYRASWVSSGEVVYG
jgi:predicted secreted protein